MTHPERSRNRTTGWAAAAEGRFGGVVGVVAQAVTGPAAGRTLAAAEWLFLSAAVLHLLAVPGHASVWVGYAAFFVLTALAQGAYSLLLPRLAGQRWFLAAGLLSTTGLLGLWVQSRLWHTPVGPHRLHAEPFGLLDVTVAVVEVFALLCLAHLCPYAHRRERVRPPSTLESSWI